MKFYFNILSISGYLLNVYLSTCDYPWGILVKFGQTMLVLWWKNCICGEDRKGTLTRSFFSSSKNLVIICLKNCLLLFVYLQTFPPFHWYILLLHWKHYLLFLKENYIYYNYLLFAKTNTTKNHVYGGGFNMAFQKKMSYYTI